MGKYMTRPKIVEAIPFEEGMEDGFHTIGEAIINGWGYAGYVNPSKFKGVPYINTKDGLKHVSQGDIVVKYENGEKEIYDQETFNYTFKPIKEKE